MKEWEYIKDLEYEYNADVGLSYASPVRGVWNIVHIGTLLPQSHEVFVCPTSCLRGVVLTTAEMNAMDRLSTITVGEDHILEGDMEEALEHGVDRILAELPERPRAMLIFTSCIHHFMAVNYHRVYKILRQKYPDIDFIDCYMNPIMRRKAPAIPSLWRQIHRLLQPAQKVNNQANLVGNCFCYGDNCDLVVMLREAGIAVRDLNTCKSYEEFLEMARSPVNFTFHNTANAAGKDMQLRLGQEWVPMRAGYRYDEIDAEMEHAARVMGLEPVSPAQIRRRRQAAEQAMADLKIQLSGTPISIDYTAVDKPLELALYLLEHGFCVESVFVDVFTETREIFEKLQQTAPELKIYQSLGWNIRQMKREHEGKVLAIGQKSAYFLNTDYFVNIVENDGMYGYRGIVRLAEQMRRAALEPKPMKELVQIKGWGCSCS